MKGTPPVRDIAEPAHICSEHDTLRQVEHLLSRGKPLFVKKGTEWMALLPGSVVGYSTTRRVADLPLIEAQVTDPDLPIGAAVLGAGRFKAPYMLVVEEDRPLGMISFIRLLGVMEQTATFRGFIAEALDLSRILFLRIHPPEDLSIPAEKMEIHGPVEKMLGYPQQVFRDDPLFWLKNVHPDDRQKLEETIRRALKELKEEEHLTLVYRFQHRNGQWIWLNEQIGIKRDRDGRPVSILATVSDITDVMLLFREDILFSRIYGVLASRRPEEALRDALAALAEEMPLDGAMLFALEEDRIEISDQWVRPEAEKSFSILREEVLEWAESGQMRPALDRHLDSLLAKGESHHIGRVMGERSDRLSRHGWLSLLTLPLIMKGGSRALLFLASRREDAFTGRNRRLAERLAPTFAAVADAWLHRKKTKELEQALEDRASQRAFELQILSELFQQMGSTLDYGDLFNQMLRHLHRVLDFDVAGSLLSMKELAELSIQVTRPVKSAVQREVRRRLLEAFAKLSGHRIGPKRLQIRVKRDETFNESAPPVEKLESAFQVPIFGGEKEIIGLLFVGLGKKEGFTEDQVKLLYEVANQASSTIQRIRALLAQEQQRLKALMEYLPEGVVLLDAERRLVLLNPIARTFLTHLAPDAKVGEVINELGGQPIERFLQPPEPGQLRELKASGRIFVINCGSLEAGPEEGGWVMMLRDVTEQRQAQEKIHRALEETVRSLASTLGKRDPYTAGHQRRVAELCRAIARKMGLPEERVQGLYMGALLHDIGKISVPVEILSKPSRLNSMEKSLIRRHPVTGYEILKSIDFPWPVAKLVLQHHERLNGTGYPNGLVGDEIILEARILAVADVVEAMSSHRPYRPGLGTEKALEELKSGRGKLYDPQVVDACVQLFEEDGFTLGPQELD